MEQIVRLIAPFIHARLDTRILEVLAQEGSLSAPELVKRLAHKRLEAVNTALHILRIRGQVQRVGLSNRFRLSPTQAAVQVVLPI